MVFESELIAKFQIDSSEAAGKDMALYLHKIIIVMFPIALELNQ